MTIVTWEDYWRLKNRLVLIYETALIKKKRFFCYRSLKHL